MRLFNNYISTNIEINPIGIKPNELNNNETDFNNLNSSDSINTAIYKLNGNIEILKKIRSQDLIISEIENILTPKLKNIVDELIKERIEEIVFMSSVVNENKNKEKNKFSQLNSITTNVERLENTENNLGSGFISALDNFTNNLNSVPYIIPYQSEIIFPHPDNEVPSNLFGNNNNNNNNNNELIQEYENNIRERLYQSYQRTITEINIDNTIIERNPYTFINSNGEISENRFIPKKPTFFEKIKNWAEYTLLKY